jgi:hypothetical protein
MGVVDPLRLIAGQLRLTSLPSMRVILRGRVLFDLGASMRPARFP